MNTGVPTTTARSYLFTAADASGNSTINITLTGSGTPVSTETIVASPAGGGIETVTAPDGSFLSSETIDPIKAEIDERRSATEDCMYNNGRLLTPKSYTVGATWTNNGDLSCTYSNNSASNFSGSYTGSGSVLSQENVTVAGVSYSAFKYQYSETYNQLTPSGAGPAESEVFTTTCDFIPLLKLNARCETQYSYAGDVPASYVADDVTQLVSATIQ